MTINKKRVDELIPEAFAALEGVKIAKDGKLDKGYRGQISAFSAAVSMGSVVSAVSFFSAQGNSDVDRSKLMEAIAKLIGTKDLFCFAQQDGAEREILHAAIALKLAMNLYDWGD